MNAVYACIQTSCFCEPVFTKRQQRHYDGIYKPERKTVFPRIGALVGRKRFFLQFVYIDKRIIIFLHQSFDNGVSSYRLSCGKFFKLINGIPKTIMCLFFSEHKCKSLSYSRSKTSSFSMHRFILQRRFIVKNQNKERDFKYGSRISFVPIPRMNVPPPCRGLSIIFLSRP